MNLHPHQPRSPAFRFYADDFLGGTMDMDQAEVGSYIRLLCIQWNRGSIPVEPERVARLAGGSVSVHVLEKFPQGPDGLRRNRRLEQEREKQAVFREKQREKGILSGQARRTTVQPQFNHGSTEAQPGPQPETNLPFPSPLPLPSPLPSPPPNQIPLGDSGTQKPKKLRKPSGGLEEVTAYFGTKSGTKAQAEDFWDWYEGNGWTQGKARTPLSNWQNAANRWIRNAISTTTPNGHHRPTVADERNRFIGGQEIWEATSGKQLREEGKGFGIE